MNKPTINDDTEVVFVEMKCLHCVLIEALDKWREEFQEKTGSTPSIQIVGNCLGAVIEDMSQEVREGAGQNAMYELHQAINEGQVKQRQAAAAEAAAEPTEANPNTRH